MLPRNKLVGNTDPLRSRSTHIIPKQESRRWNFRSASCHKNNSAHAAAPRDELGDSCASIDWTSLHDEKQEETNKSPSKRPLRKLCRTASARFFASFHTSKSESAPIPAELVDSSTTVSLTQHDDDDDDDDSSVCSFENATVTPRVHFAKEENLVEVHEVENCFYMQPQDRAATWYSRFELGESKKHHKIVLAILKKEKYNRLRESVVDAFSVAQLLADSGFEDNDLVQLDNNVLGGNHGNSVCEMIKHWSQQDVNGETCRGLEKHILRRLREIESRTARSAVVLAPHDSSAADTAARYRNLSRYATIYAEQMARADAAVAKET